MAKKHAPDCPCCGNGLVYSYDGGPVLYKDCVITCNTCHTEYKLSKLEVIALDDYMSKGLEDKAVNVLLHKDRLDQFFTTVPHVSADPVVKQEASKIFSNNESEAFLDEEHAKAQKELNAWTDGNNFPSSTITADGSLNPAHATYLMNSEDRSL